MSTTTTSIHPETYVGAVHLVISNLERSVRFYTETLGMRLLERTDDTATLTADGETPLLVLTARPDARPKPRRSTGLYHFAVLVPTRAALARSLRRLAETRYPLQGVADHLVSEALYLADPDGNGIEIYRDRPRAEWPVANGVVQMATDPLDIEGVLGALAEDEAEWHGLDPQTHMGHVHLQVADLREAERFYAGVLGFEVMQKMAGSALFVSAGGYHHHIGLNTWAGVGAPPPPADAVGLRWFSVLLPNRQALDDVVARLRAAGVATEEHDGMVELRDPFDNGIVLRAE